MTQAYGVYPGSGMFARKGDSSDVDSSDDESNSGSSSSPSSSRASSFRTSSFASSEPTSPVPSEALSHIASRASAAAIPQLTHRLPPGDSISASRAVLPLQPQPVQLPGGEYIPAERHFRPNRHAPRENDIRIDLDPAAERVQIDLEPVAEGARINLEPVAVDARVDLRPIPQRQVVHVLRGSSGAVREFDPKDRVVARTQQLFDATVEQIFAYLHAERIDLGGRQIDQMLVSINYTRHQAVITDSETGDRVTALDLLDLTAGAHATEMKRLIDETLQVNKDYISMEDHQLREFHPLNHGPLNGKSLFRIHSGVGATMESFIKTDMRAIMTRGATGELDLEEEHYLAAAKRIATVDLYHHKLQAALQELITQQQAALANAETERETRQREADIQLLNARLSELATINNKEALYYIATQQDYITAEDGRDSLFKAQRIAEDMRSYLVDVKKVNQRTKFYDVFSWFSKEVPIPEHERFAFGVGALAIDPTDRVTFHDYARKNKLPIDATPGIGITLLYASLKAHDRGEEPTEALDFVLNGIQNPELRQSVQDQFTQIHQDAVALDRRITTTENAITYTNAQTT